MQLDLKIREFQKRDKKTISKLMFRFGRYLENLDDMKRIKYSKDHEPAYTNNMLREVRSMRGQIFIAEVGGKIIGFTAGFIQKLTRLEKKSLIETKPGIVSELYVDDKYRRLGIGKKLLSTMESYLKNKGCDVVRLGVFAPNKNARAFYKKLGYKERDIDLIKK